MLTIVIGSCSALLLLLAVVGAVLLVYALHLDRSDRFLDLTGEDLRKLLMFVGGAALMVGTILIATAGMWQRPSDSNAGSNETTKGPEPENRPGTEDPDRL